MFTIADMLNLSVFQGARVLAGQAGLRQKVLFVDCIEVPDVAKWLSAHTFMFTTAYAFRDNPTGLVELVEACGQAKVAGLGVKLGRYIHDFPQEAYCAAEKYDMPLISLPEKLPWAVITRAVMREVFRDEKEEQRELGVACDDVLFYLDRDPEGAFSQLQSLGWDPRRSLWVLEWDRCQKQKIHFSWRSRVVCQKGKTRAIVAALPDESPRSFLAFLQEENTDTSILDGLALSGPVAMTELPAAFEQASLAFHLGRCAGCTAEGSVYSELKFVALLMQYAKKSVLVDAAIKELEPLLEEERRTGAELVKTLSVWLACDHSHQRSAEALFIHRNTLRNRLSRIAELIPLEGQSSFALRLALLFMQDSINSQR